MDSIDASSEAKGSLVKTNPARNKYPRALLLPGGVVLFMGFSGTIVNTISAIMVILGTIDVIRWWMDKKKLQNLPESALAQESAHTDVKEGNSDAGSVHE